MVSCLNDLVVTILTVIGLCSKLVDVYDLEYKSYCLSIVVIADIWMGFCIPSQGDMEAFRSMRGTACISNCILDMLSEYSFAYFQTHSDAVSFREE